MHRHYLALLLAGTALALAGWVSASDRPALAEALALEEALQRVIEQAEPAIACILVSRSEEYRKLAMQDGLPVDQPGRLGTFEPRRVLHGNALLERGLNDALHKQLDLADPNHVPESYGSGVVIDDQGLILTNYHVVRDATKIYVRLSGNKGSYADIHAADPRSDLAVLRVLDESILPLKAIKMGDGSKFRKGQFVLSLAHPFAAGFRDGSPSASWGIVSNLRRRAPRSGRENSNEAEQKKTLHHYGTLIQTDARLSLGCSGGALLNLKGEMIGLTTALAALHGSDTAGGFAVPMDAAHRRIILDKLRKGEEVEYGFLGVGPGPAPGGHGVQISSVTAGSPAGLAGLNSGDVILSVNGTPINEQDDLFLAIGTLLAGSKATLEVRTHQSPPTIVKRTVTLDKFYVAGKIIASQRPQPVRGLRVDYLSVWHMMQNSQFVPRMMFARLPQRGVYICEVRPDSSAARTAPMPLKVGEVVTHVNGKAVTTPAMFYHEMNEANKLKGLASPIELTLASQDPQRSEVKVTLN